MANTRARPAGFNDLTTLLGSEMDAIDIAMSRAPNEVTGSSGVVAAPATAILWGGAGLTVSGQFTASSTTTLSGTTTITFDAGSSLTLTPARTFVRAVAGFKQVLGTTTINAELLPIPTAGAAVMPLTIVPHGATITALSAQVVTNVADGLAAATPCRLSLRRRNANGLGSAITSVIGAYTSDASASDAEHTISHTLAPSQALDCTTYEYFVCVTGEDGANAQVMNWISAKVTFTLGPISFA